MKRYIVRFDEVDGTSSSMEFEFIGKGDPPTKQQFRDEVFAAVRDLAEKQDVELIKAIRKLTNDLRFKLPLLYRNRIKVLDNYPHHLTLFLGEILHI